MDQRNPVDRVHFTTPGSSSSNDSRIVVSSLPRQPSSSRQTSGGSNSMPVVTSGVRQSSSGIHPASFNNGPVQSTSQINPSQMPSQPGTGHDGGSIPINHAGSISTPTPTPIPTSTCVRGLWGYFLILMVITMAIVTVAFTISLSNQSENVSDQMVVNTGHRTRDWSSANSYSMHSSDEDQYTRLYVCMKASGITVPGDPKIDAIGDFRDAARNHHNCGEESDRGWPRDRGFLRCIQKHFNANFHQSNVFLKCLDLSEGIMVETIQTSASFIFLGSYNFVTLLLACMGVMTAFLIFTAGGYSRSNNFHEFHGHVASEQIWSPFGSIPTLLALAWSFFMMIAAMIYAFPPSNMWSDAVSGTAGALPGTPWTGFMCSGVSIGLILFFASSLAEYLADWRGVSDNITDKSPDLFSDVMVDGGAVKLKHGSDVYNTGLVGQTQSAPAYMQNDRSVSQSDFDPMDMSSTKSFVSNFANPSRHGYNRLSTQLGIKYISNLHYTGPGSDAVNIAPLLNKAFAFTWVFADGLLFVGMLNSQNSLLNENVVAIWYYIIMCRAFQLSAAFFMDDVLFIYQDSDANENNDKLESQQVFAEKEHKRIIFENNQIKSHAGIAVACSHLSSLWCMIAVIYHFSNAISVATILASSGVSNITCALQISFIIFIGIMEMIKHIVAVLAIFDFFTQTLYLLVIEVIFNADWFIRFVFITAVIFSVPQYLGDVNQSLSNTLLRPIIL